MIRNRRDRVLTFCDPFESAPRRMAHPLGEPSVSQISVRSGEIGYIRYSRSSAASATRSASRAARVWWFTIIENTSRSPDAVVR